MDLKKIVSLLCAVLLASCSQNTDIITDVQQTEQENMACEAADTECSGSETAQTALEDEMKEITMQKAIEIFQNGESGLLYFGFADCPWCKEALPVLLEEADRADTEILFIRTRDENRELLYTPEEKAAILPYMENYMSENDEGEMTLYVPAVVLVQDGIAVDGHVGTVDGHDAHERQMTEEEVEELRNIYDQMLKAA